MEKISIIVPVYNVELYLEQCLDSLVKQTFQDIKIIVINDGSTDNSQTIIDKFVLNFPDKVITAYKENGGLSSARNFGLEYAQGEYLGFIDSDDYIELDLYERMYDLIKEENADLIVCNIKYFYEDSSKQEFISKGLNNQWNTDPKKAALLSPMFAWNKLYKRDVFITNNLRYPLGLWHEDIPVTVKMIILSNKIVALDTVGVNYRQRENSIMNAKYNPKMHDIFKILDLTLTEVRHQDKLNKYHDEIEYLFIEHLLFYGAFRFLRSSGYNSLLPEAIRLIKNTFPNWRHNKYLQKLSLKNRVFIHTISPFTAKLYKMYLEKKK